MSFEELVSRFEHTLCDSERQLPLLFEVCKYVYLSCYSKAYNFSIYMWCFQAAKKRISEDVAAGINDTTALVNNYKDIITKLEEVKCEIVMKQNRTLHIHIYIYCIAYSMINLTVSY